MDLDLDLDLENLLKTDSFQLHNMPLSHGRGYSSPSPVVQPTAGEASHGRIDSNIEGLPVETPFDCPSGSEQVAIELPSFLEFQNDHHGSCGGGPRPDLKAEYLERLATLTSALFKQLSHIDSSGKAETTYFTLQPPSSSSRSHFRG